MRKAKAFPAACLPIRQSSCGVPRRQRLAQFGSTIMGRGLCSSFFFTFNATGISTHEDEFLKRRTLLNLDQYWVTIFFTVLSGPQNHKPIISNLITGIKFASSGKWFVRRV